MFTEKHILQNPYNNHKLSRTVTGYELTTFDCGADKLSGYSGSTVNLIPTYPQRFQNWSITGATLTGSAFNFDGSDVSASASYADATFGVNLRMGFTNTNYGIDAPFLQMQGYTGTIPSSEVFEFATVTGSKVFNDAIVLKEGVTITNCSGYVSYSARYMNKWETMRVYLGEDNISTFVNTSTSTYMNFYYHDNFTATGTYIGSGNVSAVPYTRSTFGTTATEGYISMLLMGKVLQ